MPFFSNKATFTDMFSPQNFYYRPNPISFFFILLNDNIFYLLEKLTGRHFVTTLFKLFQNTKSFHELSFPEMKF